MTFDPPVSDRSSARFRAEPFARSGSHWVRGSSAAAVKDRRRRPTEAARFREPSSELHIAEDRYRRTVLCDLLQLGDEEINKNRLYRCLDRLVVHKSALEAHLSQRYGEPSAVQNEVLLYDVTSTYFEGLAEANPQAQRGYSRDHRPTASRYASRWW